MNIIHWEVNKNENEMENCFDKIIREWQDSNNSLPKSLWIEEAEAFIYEGEPDTEGTYFGNL